MNTKKNISIDKETIKTGGKIVAHAAVAVGKVICTVIVTTIEMLHDVVKNTEKHSYKM